jgi:hypothetical protein
VREAVKEIKSVARSDPAAAAAAEGAVRFLERVSPALERVDSSSGAMGSAVNQAVSATFRAMRKKYPRLDPAVLLRDLAARTLGKEGRWFAAAVSVELDDLALTLARTSPAIRKRIASPPRQPSCLAARSRSINVSARSRTPGMRLHGKRLRSLV